MAKKATKAFTFGNLVSKIEDISKKTTIMLENSDTNIEQTFIDTGIYMLNALMSRNIRKGGASRNRITVLAGPSSCGKSYLCYNIAKNAQAEGYSVLYIDTEFSIQLKELEDFGLDVTPGKMQLMRTNKVEELKMTLTQMLDELKIHKQKGEEIPKMLIILDSIGQLASNKEVADALEGKNKVDMSRAKAIKSLFRIINSDLGYLNIPLLCTNHVYKTQDLFPVDKMSGGEGVTYSASTVVMMSIAKLKTGEENTDHKAFVSDLGQSGVLVTAKSVKNRLARPMKIKFEINHQKGTNPFKGLEAFCTPENYENVGICKGKMDKGKFTPNGIKYYVRHLDKTFYEKQLFTKEIFTEKVLDVLEPIIEEYFGYQSYDDIENIDLDTDIDTDIDALDDENLFN